MWKRIVWIFNFERKMASLLTLSLPLSGLKLQSLAWLFAVSRIRSPDPARHDLQP